jgi:hypothetical protein
VLRGDTRTTEPLAPPKGGLLSSLPELPEVLTAHVKLATVSLAGLIAVTFAGGLLVGMLVWRGQGRVDQTVTRRGVPAAASQEEATPATAGAPAAGAQAASTASARTETNAASATTAGGGLTTPEVKLPNPPPAETAVPATEAIVTPIATGAATDDDPAAKQPARRPTAALRAPRPRRPAAPPSAADTAPAAAKPVAAKPAARPAAAATSKPVATNAAPKPAPKSKPKSTWHDPFAD